VAASSGDGDAAILAMIQGLPAMPLSFSTFNPGQRARGLLALLILLAGLVAGVAVSQTEAAHTASRSFSEVVIPSMKRVHDLVNAVDEVRGLSALHLLLRDPPQQGALEARLSAERRMIDKRMLAYGKRLVDDTDRQHFEAVQASLARFWAAQDTLLDASRRAAADPAAAIEARDVMAGAAQTAFRQLTADLEAWWAYVERLAEKAASSARQRALMLVLPALVAVAIAALLGMAAGGLMARPKTRQARDTEAFASTLSEPHGHGVDDDDSGAPTSRAAMLDALESARQGGAPRKRTAPGRRHPDAVDTQSG